jgi:hypothetical protein
MPAFVLDYLKPLRDFFAANPDPKAFTRSQVTTLRRALGILESSERLHSGRPLESIPKEPASKASNPRQRLVDKLARARRLADWHGGLKSRHDRHVEKLKDQMAKMPADESRTEGDVCEPSQSATVTPVEQIVLTDEEVAATAVATEALVANLQLGDGPDPSMTPVNEQLMPSGTVLHTEEHVPLPAVIPESLSGSTVQQVLHDKRVRYDFAVVVTRIELDVEKKVVVTKSGERRVVAPSTQEYGPAHYAVTWSALSTLTVMVGQFAIPLNRLASLLSTAGKKFTASSLSRLLHYVAKRFVPVYLTLFKQLANSGILAGDDTTCRVVEASSYLKKRESKPTSDSLGKKEEDKAPWDGFRSPDAAAKTVQKCEETKRARLQRRKDGDRSAKPTQAEVPPLGAVIGRLLRFEWPRKDGDGNKISLNTTVVTGRTDATDPRSMIVFYRSHLGSFGNLMTALLRLRDRNLRDLTVQSDLNAANLVSDPGLLQRFAIKLVGCMSHARRIFKLHKNDDQAHCSYMLHLFTGIAMHEQLLDEFGRNPQNVTAVRNEQSRALWDDIRRLATTMAERWSPSTKLGSACAYILRHFSKLTAYLDNPLMEATNNLRERMLRTEKLIEKSALFRRSLEGRFVLDIVRTITQTAMAAEVPVRDYIEWVLRADPDEVSKNPERFTPLAYRTRFAEAPEQE